MTPTGIPERVRWIVWGAMLSSVGIYAGVLFSGVVGVPEEDSSSSLRTPLSLLGFFLAVAAVGIRMAVRNARNSSGRRSAPPWADSAFFLALALSESSAVFGFVLGVLGAGWKESATLFAVGALAILSNHPAAFSHRSGED